MSRNYRPTWKDRTFGGLCAFVMLAGVLQAQDLSPSLQEVFRAGVAAQKAGHLDEAEKAFQRVLREGGEIAYVHNNLGIVYQQRGDHARAIAQFRAAIHLQPDYVAPRVLLGASLLATSQVTEAVQQLERAVKLEPRQALARAELAQAYERSGNVAGQVEQYRALRELAPQDPEYAYQLGQAYSRQAESSLTEIRRLNPRSVRIYQTLGDAYHAQGRLDMAIRAFQRAAEIDPKLPGIHLSLAQIYLQQGRNGDARQEAQAELSIVPDSAAARSFLARIPAGDGKP